MKNRFVKNRREASCVEFYLILTVVLLRKYNEYVDRLNAIRLLLALVAAGATSDAPMANAWISKVALKIGLKGGEFHSALVYAGGQDWLDRDEKEGWTSLTRAGEALARA
jgi:hypothetical protein